VARIVLVHGAFSDSSVWERVLPGLRDRGHEAHALDLPGAGDDSRTPLSEVTLGAYASHICDALAQGPPAVLVGHSMGGVAVTQAAAECPDRVDRLIYVAAFIPADGESLLDLTHLPEGADDQVQANLVVEGDPPVGRLPPPAARDALFGCCDEEQAAWGVAHVGRQPLAPLQQPVTIDPGRKARYEALPRAYVMCRQDRAIPPALQRLMCERAGCEPVVELDTDHCPWVSRVDELVEALDAVARG
jgi:pimeloyl-ACP methyl ester carboxylesterase